MKIFLIVLLLIGGANSYSQDILTIGEVFDYEIGDEFHSVRGAGEPPNAERLTIIGKHFSLNKDSVFYKISRNNYLTIFRLPFDENILKFTLDTIDVVYTNLNSSILERDFNYDTLVNRYKTGFEYDTIVQTPDKYCGALINGCECWIGDFEPNYYNHQYGKGIGRIKLIIYFGDSGTHLPSIERTLFYFRKSGIECGTPDKTTGISRIENSDLVRIYPNPASQFLYIDLSYHDTLPCIVRLYNVYGSLVRTENGSGIFEIDVSDLSKGFYLLTMDFDNRSVNRKILIE